MIKKMKHKINKAISLLMIAALSFTAINGGEYAPKSEVVITSSASIKAKATKVDLTDSTELTFNYSVPAFVKIKDARLFPNSNGSLLAMRIAKWEIRLL